MCEVKTDDETGRTGWYGIEDVIEDIPESCELMILNRADNPSNQYGVTNHLSLLQRLRLIAVTGIEDPSQHGLALKIAQICRGFIRIDSVVFKRRKSSVAIIEPAQSVKTPPPMPYPSIARLLPKKLHIDHPIGVANDYLHISKIVDESYDEWVPNIKLSIVIPTNRGDVGKDSSYDFSHQTYPLDLIEVVVADDGSSDDPISMISEFQEIGHPIRQTKRSWI